MPLARYQPEGVVAVSDNAILYGQLERVEAVLAQFGTTHDRTFARHEKQILDGLGSKERGPFEQAHKLLGTMLGYEAGKVESDGSPDPWWIAGSFCLVFEDHAGAEASSALDTSKARQVFTHPNWMRDNVGAAARAEIVPVLVTPVSTVTGGATPHLRGVALWPLSDFRGWAEAAFTVLRELRKTFAEPGDLGWQEAAAESFQQHHLDAPGLVAMLKAHPAAVYLAPISPNDGADRPR